MCIVPLDMPPCQDPLDTFREKDSAYQSALATAEALKLERDQALLAAAAQRSVRALAAETGLSSGRVQQILSRARSHTA